MSHTAVVSTSPCRTLSPLLAYTCLRLIMPASRTAFATRWWGSPRGVSGTTWMRQLNVSNANVC